MKKTILYISIMLMMIFSMACKKKENTVVTTSTTNADTTIVATEEATQKNKEVYVGMTREEFDNIGLTYIEDYYMDLYSIRTFLDGDEGVIVEMKLGKVVSVKRFKEPIKRAKVSDIKESMTIFELIEAVGVKNFFRINPHVQPATNIAIVVQGSAYIEGILRFGDYDDDYDYYLRFTPSPIVLKYGKLYLASNEELYNECEEDDGTFTPMDLSLLAEAQNYGEVVAILGQPQRIINDTSIDWGYVRYEWDIEVSGIKYAYRVKFKNRASSYYPEEDINDMSVWEEKEFIYPKAIQ